MEGMSQRAYVRYRKERGLKASLPCLHDRIDYGWIILNQWNKIDPDQADAIWNNYRTGMRCPGFYHGKGKLEMSEETNLYGKAQSRSEQQNFLDPIARKNLAVAKMKEYELAVMQGKLMPYDAVLDFVIQLVVTVKENYSQQVNKEIMKLAAENNFDIKKALAASHLIIQSTFAKWEDVDCVLIEYVKSYFKKNAAVQVNNTLLN